MSLQKLHSHEAALLEELVTTLMHPTPRDSHSVGPG